MDNRLKSFGPRELATIFDFIANQLAEVIWICSNDYKTQLYTSPQFENFWGFSRNVMYENRDIWPTTLVDEDLTRMTKSFTQRQTKDTHPVIAFRIQRPDGSICFIKDTSFGICNKNGQQVAQMGMAKILTEAEWDELVQQKFQEKPNAIPSKLDTDFKKILIDNLQVDLGPQKIIPLNPHKKHYFIFYRNKPIQLTLAEAKCVFYLLQSYSAKLIAKYLNLSPRTVESYIENIKIKVNCNRTVELINNITNRQQIDGWNFA